MKILLDTNIVQRNAVTADPQHELVRDALRNLVLSGYELCIGFQNMAEFYVVATRPANVNGLGLSPKEAMDEVDVMLGSYMLLPDTPDMLMRWIELCRRYSVSGRTAHDTRLVALMLAHNVTRLLTLNISDFARYTEIVCMSPSDTPPPASAPTPDADTHTAP